MKKNKFLTLSIIIFLSFGIVGAGKAPRITTTAETTPTPPIVGTNIIADIVEEVGGAVVNIDVVKKITIRSPFEDFEKEFGFFSLNPEFKEFFKERVIPQKGAGSGFIIDKEGHVLTNEHVVREADEIKVTLKDGREFAGKIVGSDAALDLAILKISAKNLPVLTLGDSSKIRAGEWVIAIGNPYGFANTVTAGIISATGRHLKDLGKENLIQVDAPINPGNSGGPLLNMKGEAIGISVAIVAGAEGIGFAIPINAAKEVKKELIEKGKIVRAWLGIYYQDVDEKAAAYLELPLAEGVIITEVVKNSPADKMGLKKYDVIREINDQKIKNGEMVREIFQKAKVNDPVTIKVYREGKIKILKGKLGERP